MALIEAAKTGLQSVQNGRSYVDTLANKFVVKPKAARGIGGFVFNYEGDTNLIIQADITDHYTETNSAVEDHIAIRPIKLVFHGFVSELVLKQPEGLVGALQTIQNRLTTVPAYLSKYTPGAVLMLQKVITKTQNTVNTIDQSIARAKNIVGLFDKTAPGRTAQEKAYNKLQALMVSKQVMIVSTPWGTFNQMAIEQLSFTQDETTKQWTDITVALKRINFVQNQTSTIDTRDGRNVQQAATPTDQGNTNGTPVNTSLALRIFQGLKGTP